MFSALLFRTLEGLGVIGPNWYLPQLLPNKSSYGSSLLSSPFVLWLCFFFFGGAGAKETTGRVIRLTLVLFKNPQQKGGKPRPPNTACRALITNCWSSLADSFRSTRSMVSSKLTASRSHFCSCELGLAE